MTGQELERGKYQMAFGRDGKVLEIFYRGRRDDSLAELFPHEFITGYPPGSRSRESKSVLSLRMRDGGFNVAGRVITPIPNVNGQVFYSNIYESDFSGNLAITKLDGESMLKDLEEEGL